MSDEPSCSNSYAARTDSIVNSQRDSIEDECDDEVDLGSEEDSRPSKNSSSPDSDFNAPAIVNCIDDHAEYMIEKGNEARYAQISPEPNPVIFNIEIHEFEKRGDGINAFVVYKLETEVVNVPGYTKRHYETWRRFSDFLSLHGKLVEKYQSKGVIIPQPPGKSLSAFTKTKVGSEISREMGVDRARHLVRFINRVCQHPRMSVDCDVRDFITIESPLPKVIQTNSIAGFGGKFLKNMQDVLAKMTFQMEEGDQWFEKTQGQMEELEFALKDMHLATEKLVAARRELATSSENMSKALGMLASTEESTTLSLALSALTDITENVSAVWTKQADSDGEKLSETIHEHLMLIVSLKAVFTERIRAWQQWQDAQQLLGRKRDQKTKIDLSIGQRSEKSEQLKVEIEETIQRMDGLEKNFGDLSKAIREEVVRFNEQRRLDMKQMLVEYMENMLNTHVEMLKYWETLEPHANAIQV
uniref:PX domain-containing protein n=1 Tax=Caenorhabditis tropicalis TaxID=1561998 RepID=A0A1I7U2K5_9PELO